MRTLLILLMLTAPLAAQADLALSGTVTGTNEQAFLVNVDFGAAPQSVVITLEVAGSDGLAATFTDYDRLAATGMVGAEVAGTDPATGTISLQLTTPLYSGIHQFKVALRTAGGMGTSAFTGSVSAALAAGAITQAATVTTDTDTEPVQRLFDREVRYAIIAPAAGTPVVREFDVDFGATPQSATFYAEGGGIGPGQVSFAELLPGGGVATLGTASGMFLWQSGSNYTSSSRSGIVRFRVTLTAGAAAPMAWRCVFGGEVSVPASTTTPPPGPSPTDEGDSDSPGGCSAAPGAAISLLLGPALWALNRRKPAIQSVRSRFGA